MHPQHEDITCIKPRTACFVVHEARRGPEKFSWPNERPRPTAETNRVKVNEALQRAKEKAEREARAKMGLPPEAEENWRVSDGSWLRSTHGVLHELLLESPEFRTDALWRRIYSPAGDKRMMSLVVKGALKDGWIEDTGRGVRPTEPYTTLDGQAFALNKLVPIYRSLLYRAPAGSATISS